MEKNKIRLLIADDHPLFRDGLKQLLAGFRKMAVVGEVGNGKDLLKTCIDLSPDVVLTDIGMPGIDGIQAMKEVMRVKPQCRFLVLTAYCKEEPILRTIEAGALGYVLKSAEPAEIEEAIDTVHSNKPYFCKDITAKLTEIVSRNYQLTVQEEIWFTEREKEIMRMICREITSKEIAYLLNLSKRTVEGHRTRIMDKIGAKSIAGIITYAMRNGIYK
ncbi:MAG TPA: response regulator transcription factor [Sediminibacterium sp.]|nr:response regulator transcription factor [Sediminibacterium sp.]